MDGWIKLHRTILDSHVWSDEKTAFRWITILLSVNHSDKEVKVILTKNGIHFEENILIKAGQSFMSLDGWASRFRCSKSAASKIISNFISMKMLSKNYIGNGKRKKLLLTVCKWDDYQTGNEVSGNAKETQRKRKGNAKETQSVPNKNVKKEKKEKEVELSKESLSGKPDPSPENNLPHEVIKPKDKFFKEISEVYDYLNFKLGKKRGFQPEASHSKFPRARFAEGFCVEDLKMIIDLKIKEWLHNSKMKKYLRPDTLFNKEKFEKYIDELDDSGFLDAKNFSYGDKITSPEQLEGLQDDDVIVGVKQAIDEETGKLKILEDGRYIVKNMKFALKTNKVKYYIYHELIR